MTVVLVHPVAMDATIWPASLIDTLQESHDVFCYELPGHGKRAGEEIPRDIGAIADDLHAVCSDLPGEAHHFIGISIGGAAALHLAIAYPNSTASLLVACSGATFPSHVMETRAQETTDRGVSATLDQHLDRWLVEGAKSKYSDRLTAHVVQIAEKMTPAALAATWRTLKYHDLRSRLDEARTPTTVLYGQKDSPSGIEASRELAAGLPNARLVRIPGAHFAPFESPELFTKAVLEHLDFARKSLFETITR